MADPALSILIDSSGAETGAKIRTALIAYGATSEEVQHMRLQRRQQQPIDWSLVEQLAAIPCSILEVALAIGMSESSLRRAIRLWPEHRHLFTTKVGS